ncbi:thioredoxin domain-containing protein [Candidatus Parcubacteria bacterium]|nr:thioredoxin domain-containing protein [Candidatus Parcubacteria bacterium]
MNYKKGNVAIAASIVVAGLIIAGAVMFTNKSSAPTTTNPTGSNNGQTDEGNVENLNPVDENDWVRGNPDAEITIVEYSDTECPYCNGAAPNNDGIHNTLKQVMDEYGDQVNWVYRHFAIKGQKATTAAHSLECAGEIGGNDIFWEYLDKVYKDAGDNNGTDTSKLSTYAQEIGINVDEFNSCMEESRHIDKIQEDIDNAVATGGRGTPHSIIVAGDEKIVIPGAQPFQQWKSVIDSLLE